MYGHKIIADGECLRSILIRIKKMFMSCKELDTINIVHVTSNGRCQVANITNTDCNGAMCMIADILNKK